jgi:hypothetical protein
MARGLSDRDPARRGCSRSLEFPGWPSRQAAPQPRRSRQGEACRRCNGAHSPSVYSKTGRCKYKPVRGDQLEGQVWSDVETFLRDPEPVLQQFHAKLEAEAQGSGQFRNR